MTPSRKQYAFASFSSLSQSKNAVSMINGCTIQALCQDKSFLNDHLLTGPPISIYLLYISAIPILFTAEQEKCQAKNSAPPGLILIPRFISEAEESAEIITRMMHDNLVAHKPDQLTVNQYLPGQGNNMFNILPFCS